MESLQEFCRGIPKVLLHVHLDGSLPPSFILSRANGASVMPSSPPPTPDLTLPPDVTEPRHVRPFLQRMKSLQIADGNKQRFKSNWSTFDYCNGFLQSYEDLQEVTKLILDDLYESHNVVGCELRFCPTLHTKKSLTESQAVEAVLQGASESVPSICSTIILCALRSYPASHCEAIAKLAHKFKLPFDIAGDEGSFPLSSNPMSGVQLAHSLQIPMTLHAGEWPGSLPSLSKALTDPTICPNRIGHGIRVIEDPSLCALARSKNITFEVCPTSNCAYKVKSFQSHPIKEMIRTHKLKCTLSPDNTLLSGTLADEANPTTEAVNFLLRVGMTLTELRDCMLNAVDATFIKSIDVASYKRCLNDYFDKYTPRLSPVPGHISTLQFFPPTSQSYLLYLPDPSVFPPPHPVILHLHGKAPGGEGHIRSQVLHSHLLEEASKFAVLAPLCTSKSKWCDDVPLVLNLLAAVLEQHPCCDPNRVSISGVSMGGNGALLLAAASPSTFAACLSICPYMKEEEFHPTVTSLSLAALPLWIHHSADDELVDVSESDRLSTAISHAKYTRYKSAPPLSLPNGRTFAGHKVDEIVFGEEEVWSWLSNKKKVVTE